MVREICRDEAVLSMKSQPATAADLAVAADLLETLRHHKDGCVGMAANMIGICKRIIAFEGEDGYQVMFNPVIVKQSEPYETQEGLPLPLRRAPGQALWNHQGLLAK